MKTLLGILLTLICLAGISLAQKLIQSDSVVVKPGSSHTLTCKGDGVTLSSYWMSWVRQAPNKELQWLCRIYSGSTYYADAVKGRMTISSDNSNNIVSLQINNMNSVDTAVYYCASDVVDTALDYLDIWGPGTPLTVTAAEKKAPTVFPLLPCHGSISSSSHVTIGCLSTSYFPPPVDVTWNSGSITSEIRNFPDILDKSGTYLSTSLLTVSAEDYKNKKYTCNVNHKITGQTTNKDLDIRIDQSPKAPAVKVVQASCGETGSVDLICLIDGYSPDKVEIKWLSNGQPTSISPANSTPYKDSDGKYGIRSQVSIPRSDWSSGKSYTCRVNHSPTNTRIEERISKCPESISSSSQPKVVILPPSPQEMLISKQPLVTCEVSKLLEEARKSLKITWRRSDGKNRFQIITREAEQDLDGKWTVKGFLNISIADWNSKVKFTCIVSHNGLSSPVEKTIQKREEQTKEPTIYVFPPTKEELSSYDFVGLYCLLKDFSHKNLYVQWKKNSQVIEETYYLNTEPIKDEKNDYLMYSRLVIKKSDWEKGSTFTCSGVLSKITSKEIKTEKCRGK